MKLYATMVAFAAIYLQPRILVVKNPKSQICSIFSTDEASTAYSKVNPGLSNLLFFVVGKPNVTTHD